MSPPPSKLNLYSVKAPLAVSRFGRPLIIELLCVTHDCLCEDRMSLTALSIDKEKCSSSVLHSARYPKDRV